MENFPISRARCCSLDVCVLGVASNVLLLTVPSSENHVSVPGEHYLDRDASDLGGNPSSVISPRAPWSEQSHSRANSSRMPGVHLHSKGLQTKPEWNIPFLLLPLLITSKRRFLTEQLHGENMLKWAKKAPDSAKLPISQGGLGTELLKYSVRWVCWEQLAWQQQEHHAALEEMEELLGLSPSLLLSH